MLSVCRSISVLFIVFAEWVALRKHIKNGRISAKSGRFRLKMTQKSDCAVQNPTEASLFMFARFNSIDEWT